MNLIRNSIKKLWGKSSKEQTPQHTADFTLSGISIVNNAICFPLATSHSGTHDFEGGMTDETGKMLIPEGILIRYGKNAQTHTPPDNIAALINYQIKKLPGTYYFGGVLLDNFGHFLLESLSRLWAYRHVNNKKLKIVFFVPWGIPPLNNKKNYITQAFESLSIPLHNLIMVTEPLQLENVLIPKQIYGFGNCLNPDPRFTDFIKTLNFESKAVNSKSKAQKLYVSRSALPFTQGKPSGETILEAYLQTNGYQIVHPEKLTLIEQLNLYTHASHIIFCDGGATYCNILLPDLKASIAVIARRRDTRWNYIEITDHFKGYKKNIVWIDEVIGQYQFGLESWNALAEINWENVSKMLMLHHFVDKPLKTDQALLSTLLKKDIATYIEAIRTYPEFIEYMQNRKETPALLPSSFTFDTPSDTLISN